MLKDYQLSKVEIDPSTITKVFIDQSEDHHFIVLWDQTSNGAISEILSIKKKSPIADNLNDFFTKKNIKENIPIIYSQTGFNTLIPKEYYDSSSEVKYLKINCFEFDSSKHSPNRDYINWLNAKNIYFNTIKKSDALRKYFPTIKFVHTTSLFLKFVNMQGNNEECMYCQLKNNNLMLIALGKNGVLKFCNDFETKTLEDVLYFILGAYKSLGFDRNNVLNIMGDNTDFELVIQKLSDYLPQVKVIEAPESYVTPGLHKFLPKKYHPLIIHINRQNIAGFSRGKLIRNISCTRE
jgi:hypothetical protein